MRRLLPLAVLILAAFLAWLVLGESAAPPERGSERSSAEPTDRDAPRSSGPAGAGRAAAATGERRRKHASAPDPVSTTPADEKLQRFTVHVVDGYDRPVAGVPVLISDAHGGTWRTTRSDGTTSRDVPEDVPILSAVSKLFDTVTLTDPETTVMLEDLIPLQIDFVCQETGRPLEVTITGSPLESDSVLSHQRYTTYRARAAPVRPGRLAALEIGFGVPDGYASIPDGRVSRGAVVSRYTTSARTTIPIAREVQLQVTVLRHDGSPAKEATVTARVSGAVHSSAAATTSAAGQARIEDLPFLRGERLSVHASDAEGRQSPTETLTLVDADRELALELRLPAEPADQIIGIGGGAGGAFSSRSSKRHLPAGTGRLTVALTRRNGLPAAGAYAFASGPVSRRGHADADGRIEFTKLPAGEYAVTLREPGLVATTESVVLLDGEARTIALRETIGRAATVRVLDHDGLPLPNVRLVLTLPWGAEHIQLVDGEQQLDHWTDLSGRCRFTDIPATGVTVKATLGSRTVERKLVGGDLDITLPAR